MEGKKIKLGDKVEGIANVENGVLKIDIEVNEDNMDEVFDFILKIFHKIEEDEEEE